MLVSGELQWHSMASNPRDFVGDHPELDASRLVTIRTINNQGDPVPYCRVTYFVRDQRGFGEYVEAGTDN